MTSTFDEWKYQDLFSDSYLFEWPDSKKYSSLCEAKGMGEFFDPEISLQRAFFGQTTYWRTKDKRVLLVDDMTHNHICNTYNFVDRWWNSYKWRLASVIGAGLQGEMAIMAAERMADEIMDSTVKHAPLMREFAARIQTRGLNELRIQAEAYAQGKPAPFTLYFD